MTRVCVVVENHPSAVMGGAQYQGHLLAEELARQDGVSVTYLARRANLDAWKRAGGAYDVRIIGNTAGIRARSVAFDGRNLARALEELAPDVVYQQMRQSYTDVCARYCQAHAIPFFFHIASDMDLDPAILPARLLSRNLPFDVVEAVLGIRGMRAASHVIAQTDRQSRVLHERFGRSASVIVRNFQPLPEVLPTKPRDGKFRVFWVANFKDVKRPWLFVDLAERLAARTDIEFIMAGRASKLPRHVGLMERIKRVPNLKYLGELSIDEVNAQMAISDMHVNTSSVEGFPNTFIQAWANGAIVATIAVDPDEEGMEKLGIGFCTGTLDRLADLIERLAASPEECSRIARQSLEFAKRHHSMDRCRALIGCMLDAAAEYAARKNTNAK